MTDEVRVSVSEDVGVISFSGQIRKGGGWIKDHAVDLITSQPRLVVFDLTDLRWLNSTAMGAFEKAFQFLESERTRFAMVSKDTRIREIFVYGNRVFDWFDTKEDAVVAEKHGGGSTT
jgi:anti-anti-sigma regulatory factor